MTRVDLQAALQSRNVGAWLRVLRQGESNQDDTAYTIEYGRDHFTAPPWVHPWHGIPTTQGAKASGAYQFLGTTWSRLAEQYGFPDFSPACQDEGAVALTAGRGALEAVLAGKLQTAMTLCGQEWTSLQAMTYATAAEVFTAYGGTLDGTVPAPQPTPKAPMGAALALLPLIAQLIPQIATLIKPKSESTARDAAVAQTILNTVVQAAGVVTDGTPATATTVGQAVDKMQADPALTKTVQQAVVTHPDVLPLMEVGGGVAGARAADIAQQGMAKPFWQSSAVFWISMALLPLVYWYVGSTIVGGVAISDDAGWYLQLLKVFGREWTGESRAGIANLVLGLTLGGICGVYFGVSVTQNRQSNSEKA